MKKIIEAAEQVCELRLKFNSDTLSRNLCDAIAEYKRLKETPITEEWLKEHGWHISDIDPLHYARLIISANMLEYDLDRHELTVFRCYEPESKVCAVDNMAKLYDACELCGIKLE